MSSQKGIIKLEGVIGDISFYKSGGKFRARTPGGPSKSRMQTDPAFVRTRENNKEFGGAATAGKALRMAFSTSLANLADGQLVARLTKVFKLICNRDTAGIRGRRSFLASQNQSGLESIEFNIAMPLSMVFTAPYTASHVADRNEVTVTIPDFDPAALIQAPAGATHFRILHAIGAIADLLFNSDTLKYEPSSPALSGIGNLTRSDSTALSSGLVNFSLTNTFPSPPALTSDVTVMQALGIEFYQRIGANDYLLAQSNTMKIIQAF